MRDAFFASMTFSEILISLSSSELNPLSVISMISEVVFMYSTIDSSMSSSDGTSVYEMDAASVNSSKLVASVSVCSFIPVDL